MNRPASLQLLADQVADYFGLSRELLRAMVTIESAWRPDVVSTAGAVGLTQVLPSTARWLADDDVAPLHRLGLPQDLSEEQWHVLLEDPELNLLVGAGYLVRLLRMFGDARLAIAAYNAGEGRIGRLLRERGSSWHAIRPYVPEETRGHVGKVFRLVGDASEGGWLGAALVTSVIVAGAVAALRQRG